MAYYDNVSALNPKLWYKFNETTGTPGNSGSLSNSLSLIGSGASPTLGNTGIASNCVSFNNVKYYQFSAISSGDLFDDRTFSIEFWHKELETTSNSIPQYLFNWGDGTSKYLAINYVKSTAKYTFQFKGGSGYPEYNMLSNAVTDMAWHHIVVTFSPSEVKLYIDGSLHTTQTSPNIPNSFTIDTTSTRSIVENAKCNFDELAIYGQTLTATEVFNNYDSAYNATSVSTTLTASALLPMPAITAVRNPNNTASVMTASSLFAQPSFNTINFPTMLDTYLAGRSFEQWYKFDEIGKIHNYGSGGNAETAWAFNGASINVPQDGIQGSGTLKIKGEVGNSVTLAFGVNAPYSTEITDNEFSIGLWFKGESGFGAKNTNLVSFTNPFSTDYYYISIDPNGYPVFTASGTQTRTVTATTNVLDGNWHLIQARASDTNDQIAISLDNGTEVTTAANGSHWPSGIGAMQLGSTFDTGTNNKYGYISNMWITGYDSIGSTERAAMITAAAVPIQGTAKIIPATARFTNQYQEKIDTYSPKIAFRLNEASGAPTNYGSGGTLSVGKNGTNITYLQPTQNTYAYKFTNADTYIQGDYSYSSGTFSSGNHQTMSAVFKAESTVNFEQIIGSMGMYGFLGSGITLSIGGTNGYLEARINQGFGGTDTDSLTTTINVCDNQYHHAVGVRDGSSFKLYLDGKQVATMSNAGTTLSDAATYGISAEGKFNFGQGSASKALHIDEFAVMSTSLSAAQIFELYRLLNIDGAFTASSLMVQPTNSAGTGTTINPGVSTGTALFVDPSQLDTIAPIIAPMTLEAMFQMPNFEATKNTNNAAAVMTASATAENPAASAGGIVGALHMNASALFPEGKARLPGVWNASPFTISSEMVQPGLATTKGALIKPQSLNAKAMMPIPPAYFTLFDDLWFNRLYNLDKQTTNSADFGFLHFFTQSSNLSKSSYLAESGYDETTGIQSVVTNKFFADPAINENASPIPAGIVGYLDAQNRKAINIRNISFLGSVTNTRYPGFTLETMIKTTKSNQVLFKGEFSGTSSVGYDAIYLKDGKLAWTTTFGYGGSLSEALSRTPLLLGNKNIADGEWHHIIIQNVQADQPNAFQNGRTQIWIDGKLDIQRYGIGMFRPSYIGANSGEATVASDFFISGISINAVSLVQEREVALNYFAAINHIPFEATPATASATITPNNKAKGNRGRALMLYFWPTFSPSSGFYRQNFSNPFRLSEYALTNADQGLADDLDQDTFFGLTTWAKNMPEKFYDWDIFPLPVTGHSDLAYTFLDDGLTIDTSWKHPLIKDGIVKSGTTRGVVYVDPVTDNYRYLDVMNDLKDLSQFDMICFRNYPDQSGERDLYGTTSLGVADTYFNIQDKYLYENFLKSLRDAVDTGISLFITNPQLAIDLGFIEGYEKVSDLDGVGGPVGGGDTYAPKKAGDPLNVGLPALDYPDKNVSGFPLDYYNDTYKNNYHRIVNTLPGLTDDPSYIWTDHIFYNVDGNREYGGLERWWDRYEYKPNGLSIGDKFIIADERETASYYAAVPFDKIKAGKVITAFDSTYRHGITERANPYANYATTIAVEPGTIVNGKQIGAKVFISFTELLSNSFTAAANKKHTTAREYALYELKTDAEIDLAYNNGLISQSQRVEYKADTDNLDRRLELGQITQNEYNKRAYWSYDGTNILGVLSPYGNQTDNQDVDTSDGVVNGRVSGKTRKNRKSTSTSSFPAYNLSWGNLYPTYLRYIPSINTRGMWWLSERLEYDVLPQRPSALTAIGEMPQPTVSGYKVASINAQAAVASATIAETTYNSGARTFAPVPMYATAQLVNLGKRIDPGVATASASLQTNIRIIKSAEDDIVLYIMHEDPILYIREDAIK